MSEEHREIGRRGRRGGVEKRKRRQRRGQKAQSVGSEGGGETFFGGVFVEVEEIGGALEQIGREIAGLIVDKAGGVGESDFAAGAGHFESAEAV